MKDMFLSLVVISWISLITEALPPKQYYYQGSTKSLSHHVNNFPINIFQSSTRLAADLSFSEDSDESSSFDMDFADAMSKPIPEWHNEEKKKREVVILEVQKNRERIISDFKAKYEVTEEQKKEEQEAKWNKIRERMRKQKKSELFIEKVMGALNTESLTQEELAMLEKEDGETTTYERWEKLWEEEEKQTGFKLPGFFEVFPELKLNWPTWSRKKDGSAIPCYTDSDCPFPQACCDHPIIPGDKFCCTGWGQRVMVPAYARQFIKTGNFEDQKEGGKDDDSGSSWKGGKDLDGRY